MTIAIECYIAACTLLLLFEICFLFLKNAKIQQLKPDHEAFEEELSREIRLHQETGAFSDDFIQTAGRKLSQTKNMITLQNMLEKMPKATNWFRPLLLEQLSAYEKKKDEEQAFYIYMISLLDYHEEKVPADFASRFIGFLDSKSLYTFTNTMAALYAFGESSLLLQAMEKINARSGFYHKKLLVDGLLRYQGDFDELNQALVKQFYRYAPHTQECLLDYFRLQEYDVSDLCLSLMQDAQADVEVQHRALRYFHKFRHAEAKQVMLELLKKEETSWIKQMLAIQGLKGYDDAETVHEIRRKLFSRNWHVRINAVEYFYQKGMDQKELQDILELRDKYTNEALLYQFRNDPETSAYIMERIRAFEEEEVRIDALQNQQKSLPAIQQWAEEGGARYAACSV